MNDLEKTSANLINGCLKDKSEKDLRYAIDHNVNLADLVSSILPMTTIKLIRIAASFYRTNGLSSDVVLNLLDLQRPDLVRIIRESEKNHMWFKKNVRDVRKLFGV